MTSPVRESFRPRALHVFALFNLAVAHPLCEVLAGAPEFFVAHRSGPIDVLLTALLVSIVLPGVFVALAWLVGRVSRRAGLIVHLLVIGVLVAVLALQLAGRFGISRAATAFWFAGLVGLAALMLYARFAPVRVFAGLLAPAIVLVPLLFVVRPTVRPFVFPSTPKQSARVAPSRTPPIVVAVFDQLPVVSLFDASGGIDRRLYPGFAALADEATWFRNATAVADYTGWALPPIFTGVYPRRGALPTAASHPDSLFSMLAGTYQMKVFEPITRICPESLCPPDREPLLTRLASATLDETVVFLHIITPEELAGRLPPVSQNWKNFAPNRAWLGRWASERDADRRDQPTRFIEQIQPSATPTLYVIHMLIPHEPFIYVPSGQAVASGPLPGLGPREIWIPDEWAVAQNYQAHLAQVGYADTLLGQIVERLKKTGLFDDAVIAVTADHGARFRPGEPFKHMERLHGGDIMAVPLLIKVPGRPGGVVSDRNVQTVDVTPTIAGALGVELPWKHDGINALDRKTADRSQKVVFTNSARQIIRRGPDILGEVRASVERKLSLFRDGDPRFPLSAPRPELIDRPVSSLRVGEPSQDRAVVHDAHRFSRIDPAADFIPARVTGEVPREFESQQRLPLAVAVNGLIRATTWTAPGVNGRWLAYVPPDSFREGRNDVQVFLLEERSGTVVLHQASDTQRPADLNLISAAARHMWGVRQDGLYDRETNGTLAFRWTNGAARLEVPLEEGTLPTALRIDVGMTSPRRTELRILVNGCELYRGPVTAGWSQTLSLASCPLSGATARIELLSDTFRPPRDQRMLGVGVSSVMLLDTASR